ncbi:Putative Zn-dependent protease [Tangfeifania diversioriginum]|uniref:Putative Zn-dependent protease n=1 Tax=Tangfeifania diversioriginum TaxID=1168035 RepID=A0A1M6HEX9_9BACT|nr:M48 family metalloprotease [Tangfeifania diversioriginum]SHJ20669.1 Putative Zn-dependent protease [Tangfeifania diversioriginum]
MKKINILTRLTLIISILLMVPSCAVNPVTGKRQLMLMSEAQEIAMGEQYDPQVISTFGQYEDEQLMRLIQAKGDEMGKISHRPNLQYHFRILDTPVVNAFAVPGGYIYFTRGILAQFNNEAELMGVLGHEMGHITARHTVSQQSKQQLGQLLLIGGMIASEDFREFAGYAMQGMQLLFLKFSRDNEREADRLGVEYTSRISYDGQKMADFFNVLNKMQMESSQGGIPTFLSTHPDPGDRYTTVTQLAGQWKDSLGYNDWQVNEDNYLQMIDGMVYGEDPRQGYVDGNAFYHPEMKFQFPVPAGWQLENSPLQVQMAPKEGNAMMIFSMARQDNLDEAAETTLSDLELNVLDSERTTVNGMPAISAVSDQASQSQQTGEQQTIKVVSYFIDYNDAIYVFHGVSTGPDFNSWFRTFESTMMNFNRLTDPAKLSVQPKRIDVRRVQRASTLAQALDSFGVPQSQMDDLALLNNMELTDRVQAGKLLKTIVE